MSWNFGQENPVGTVTFKSNGPGPNFRFFDSDVNLVGTTNLNIQGSGAITNVGTLAFTAADGTGSGVAGKGFTFTTGAGGGGNSNSGPLTVNLGAGTGTGTPGAFSIIPGAGKGTNAGMIALGTASATIAVPDDTTTINLIQIKQNFGGTTNAPNGNSARLLNADFHYVDSTNSLATGAAGYFNAYHDGAGTTITDHFALIGRCYVTGTGIATNMWGVRGDCQFTGAGSAVDCYGLWSRFPTQNAGSSITTWHGLKVDQVNFSVTAVTDAYAGDFGIPAGATGNKVGVNIGLAPVSGNYTIGLNVNTNGAWFRGNATLPVHADTSTTQCIIACLAGNDAAANDTNCLIYFYRSSTAQGFFGFDTNASQVLAGHTKVVGDLVLGSDKCVVDVNGQLWSAGQVAGNSMSIVPAVKASGTVGTSYTYTGAAHTGLTPGVVTEFNFNAARTISFDNTGGTITTAYTFQFQRPTYSAAAALTMTDLATVRITGAPSASASAGFSPTLTTTWALLVSAGSSFFGGAVVQGHATAAINTTNTATAAQAATGYITSTSAATVTITLPTGTALGAALNAVQGTIHDLYIDNTAGSNVVTIAVNTNAILSSMGGTLTVPSGVTGQACFRLMFSSATAYTFTRVA